MSKHLVVHRCLCLLTVAFLLGAQSAIGDSLVGWKQLFNGHDLTGWKHVGEGSMRVENNMVRTAGRGVGLLYWTGGPVSNCTIRVVYRTTGDYDHSGVFVRIPIEPRDLEMPSDYGYQVHIDNHPETSYEDEYHFTGTLYSFTRSLAKPWKPGPEWNILEITLDGGHTIVMLNGVKVTDYAEGDPVPERKLDWEPQRGRRPDEGWIGLENDDGKKHTIFFKEIAIKALR
jgi:hypothetical protein